MRRQRKEMFKNPASGILQVPWKLCDLCRTDSRPTAEREEDFRKTIREQEALWDETAPFFPEMEPKTLVSFANALNGTAQDLRLLKEDIPDGFKDLGGDRVEELKDLLERLAVRILAEQKTIRAERIPDDAEKTEEIPDDRRILKMPEEDYRAILRDELGVDLSELLAWYEDEIRATRGEALEIASKLSVPDPKPASVGEVNDLLWKYAGPCDTPEEMFRRADLYLKRTRALAHEVVWLPEDEQALCVKVPSQLRYSYPWGGYEGGDKNRRPITGQMFLNHYNFRQVTDGWIKMNAMHETYPGHHVQYVRAITDTLPQTFKEGAKSIPLTEGTAHRTERAFEFIYGEDPFFPLFVAYRRHHTAVRIKADLMLFYFGSTMEEVTRLYMDEMGFAHDIARGQVLAHINMPGYFVCYYYGMKKLCGWEKDYGYNKKDYTEELFSAGNISLENFKRYLDLPPEDKTRFKTDFASLLMKPETFK